MWDDNLFIPTDNEWEICAFCGSTHVNDKFCPMQLKNKKGKISWICHKLSESLGNLIGMF